MSFPRKVRIVDVGPRDGLQNEARRVPTEVKIELIHRLAEAGLPAVEAAAFVSPKWVPQMSDGAQVMAGLRRKPGVAYPVLVPNLQGFRSGVRSGRGGGRRIRRRFRNVQPEEHQLQHRAEPRALRPGRQGRRGNAKCACAATFPARAGCPYEGDVSRRRSPRWRMSSTRWAATRSRSATRSASETPRRIRTMIEAVAKKVPMAKLGGHYHDTYGQALANIYASLEAGVRTFDSSVAGLGGCPYAKGATATSRRRRGYMLDGLGIETGVDLMKLLRTGQFICKELGREPASRAARALAAKFDA